MTKGTHASQQDYCNYLAELKIGTGIDSIERALSLPNPTNTHMGNSLYKDRIFEYVSPTNSSVIKVGLTTKVNNELQYSGDYAVTSKSNTCSNWHNRPDKAHKNYMHPNASWKEVYALMSKQTLDILQPIADDTASDLHRHVFYASYCYPIILAYIEIGDAEWFNIGLSLYRRCDAGSCHSYRDALHKALMNNPEINSSLIEDANELRNLILTPIEEKYEENDERKRYLSMKLKSIKTRYQNPGFQLKLMLTIMEQEIEKLENGALKGGK